MISKRESSRSRRARRTPRRADRRGRCAAMSRTPEVGHRRGRARVCNERDRAAGGIATVALTSPAVCGRRSQRRQRAIVERVDRQRSSESLRCLRQSGRIALDATLQAASVIDGPAAAGPGFLVPVWKGASAPEDDRSREETLGCPRRRLPALVRSPSAPSNQNGVNRKRGLRSVRLPAPAADVASKLALASLISRFQESQPGCSAGLKHGSPEFRNGRVASLIYARDPCGADGTELERLQCDACADPRQANGWLGWLARARGRWLI